MKEPTKYSYEKRIKHLQDELAKARSDLYQYKLAAERIHNALCEELECNRVQIKIGWVIKQFKITWR